MKNKLNSKLETKWNNASIRSKLLLAFLLPMVLILIMNVYVYIGVNTMITRIDEIYEMNVSLNELSEELTAVQTSMKEYLENKSSVALQDFYKADQNYRNGIDKLGRNNTHDERYIMEQNIISQSENYLKMAGETIQAKRGRNVEKYKSCFEESEILYSDLQSCIYSLNNAHFKINTDNYFKLLTTLRYMEIASLVILVFIGVFNIVILYLLTKSMTKPLIELSSAANEVATGNFEVELEPLEGEDEISVVSNAFTKMVDSIQVYIHEIRESMHRESELKEHELVMESRMKEVELRNLQAQINPHFLFNTLNAGAQLAMMEGADKTTEFIQNMADFFRYNIKKINMDATVAEEVELVDKYIYIINVRFTGEINYSKEVDETVTHIRVPSMILQPIVENAINYGVRNIDWEKHIDLRITKDEELVYLSIKDNGSGMSKEAIDKVLTGHGGEIADSQTKDSNGVGLANVIERLQIFTGRQDVMEIRSEGEGKGTEFIIKIPYMEGVHV